MRFLGIDYGLRRIGLSLSDESGTMAFPLKVIFNDKNTLDEIAKVCKDEDVKVVVLGESKDLKGNPNPIMKQIEDFKKNLENLGISVQMEPEFLTSVEAERIQGKNKGIDASAATIILNSFLEKNKNKNDNN